MAQIELGIGFNSIKGKIGGVIFQGNKGRQVAKNRTSFNKGKIGRMENSHNIMQFVAREWAGVSNIDKLAWATQAQSYPVTDKFGNPRILSGYSWFCKVNSFRVNNDLQLTKSILLPDPQDTIVAFSVQTFNVTQLDIETEGSDNTSNKIRLFFSKPYSRGQNPSVVQYILAKSAIPQPNMVADYISIFTERFGRPTVGMKVFFKMEIYDTNLGLIYETRTMSSLIL